MSDKHEPIYRDPQSGQVFVRAELLAARERELAVPPGKVLVDVDFIHEAKRLLRRAEDRLPLGAKLNADIASWIDRAKALFPYG